MTVFSRCYIFLSEKQLSIDKFCSPLKQETHTSNPVSSTPPKPKGLFKYFSPEKKTADSESRLDDNSDERTKLGECDKDFETKLGECDKDFETFLKEEDDLFDCDTETGRNDSNKRSKFDARNINDCETKSRLRDGVDKRSKFDAISDYPCDTKSGPNDVVDKRSKFDAISDCDIFNDDDDDLFDEIKEPQHKKQRR